MLAFALAVLVLLLAPGPTNILLAVAASRAGFTRTLRLIPVELAAYGLTVVPLSILGHELALGWPVVTRFLTFASALWVLYLAGRLWRWRGGAGVVGPVRARDVFVTTLLNPKVLVLGLVLLPRLAGRVPLTLGLAVLLLAIGISALLWTGVASLYSLSAIVDGQRRQRNVNRLAAVWLALVSAGLTAGAWHG